MIALIAILVSTIATLAIGAYGVRIARSTSDFFVASRAVPPMWNASAISGEYLSAASFLGVAGLIMKFGLSMLWYPVGFAAGYVTLLILVAAPLRRFGAYTIPDFAEGRLDSPALRRLAVMFVLLVGWFYLLPQMRGAGLTLHVVLGLPRWVGVVLVATVITANISLGGMKGITFVQAFQYWLKVTAIALPAFFLIAHTANGFDPTAERPPTFTRDTTVELDSSTRFRVAEPTRVQLLSGQLDGSAATGSRDIAPGEHAAGSGAVLHFPRGVLVPHVTGVSALGGAAWAVPNGGVHRGNAHPLFSTYSLIIATFLGTMGLPHILVRFYTNPDGRAARKTTLIVLLLLGAFYLFPAVYGVLGRTFAPELYLTGQTDSVVLVLPRIVVGGLAGELLGALVAAGAFAAFLSTASGLLISVAGSVAYDLLGGSVREFRYSAIGTGLVSMLLGLLVVGVEINVLVGWAFAIAASTFCPLLVLGIWWRSLTAAGASAGMLAGGGLASLGIVLSRTSIGAAGWPSALLTNPAAWSVPLAFTTMVVVSRLTARRVPVDVDAKMLALHLPESLRATT
ncbi:MAG: cation acetate symporter [Mycobacteriales bacterium]